MVAPIDAHTYRIGEFIANHKMVIPELQRPYAWTEVEGRELFADIETIITKLQDASQIAAQTTHEEPPNLETPQHFFGTVVLIAKGEILPIIDGQQRLTTVTTLLGLIEDAFRKVEAEAERLKVPDAVRQAAKTYADEIRLKLWYTLPMDRNAQIKSVPRLAVSREITGTYESLLNGGKGDYAAEESAAAQNLRNIAEIFRKEVLFDTDRFRGETVNKLRHVTRVYEAVAQGLLVVSLKTQTPDAGYDLFESLNARGLPLNVLDLMKVWIMSHLSSSNASKDAVDKAVLSLAKLTGGDVKFQQRFFNHYFRARALRNVGGKGSQQAKLLSLDTRKFVFKDPDLNGAPDHLPLIDRIFHELEVIEAFTPIAEDLESKSDPAPSVVQYVSPNQKLWVTRRLHHTMAVMKHTGISVPLFIVAADKMRHDPNRYAELVHTIEKFFFRYKAICRGEVKAIEVAYYDFIRILDSNGTIEMNLVKQKLNDLILEAGDDSEFKEQLAKKLTYKNASLVKVALHTAHLYSFPQKPKQSGDELANWELEHIAPQKPKGPSQVSPELIDSLGNLCLLNPEINRRLRNLSYEDKKAKVADLEADNKHIDVKETDKVFKRASNSWTDVEVVKRQTAVISTIVDAYKL